MTKPLRAKMPQVSAFVDSLRSAFGAEEIDAQIRRGMKGEPLFYASENGAEIGTPSPTPSLVVEGAAMIADYQVSAWRRARANKL